MAPGVLCFDRGAKLVRILSSKAEKNAVTMVLLLWYISYNTIVKKMSIVDLV